MVEGGHGVVEVLCQEPRPLWKIFPTLIVCKALCEAFREASQSRAKCQSHCYNDYPSLPRK